MISSNTTQVSTNCSISYTQPDNLTEITFRSLDFNSVTLRKEIDGEVFQKATHRFTISALSRPTQYRQAVNIEVVAYD
jgi:hypothetical protein